MTTTLDAPLQSSLQDAPSAVSVLRSPGFLVRESLAGIITALALIPEVISFSFISGVDPKTALFSSVVLCLVMSVLGGRPAMVTAAAVRIGLAAVSRSRIPRWKICSRASTWERRSPS